MSLNSSSLREWLAIVVAIVIGAVGVLAPSLLEQASLSYEILDESPVINQENIDGNWTFLYENTPVVKPFSLIYLIKNTGRTTIKKDDYDNSISINLGNSNRVLSAFISISEPDGIKQFIDANDLLSVDGSELSIKPLTLNSGDSFTLKVIVDDLNRNEIGGPTARIGGVTKIQQSFSSREVPKLYFPVPIPRSFYIVGIVSTSILMSVVFKKVPFLSDILSRNMFLAFVQCACIILALCGFAVLMPT